MPHVPPLVSTLAIGLVLAFSLGVLAHRFKLPPLVGYLLAGIVLGPFTPGYVADQNIANQLAEVGVILLVRCRAAFLLGRPDVGEGDRDPGRHCPDCLRNFARHGAWSLAWLVDRRCACVWACAVGGEYRRSPASASGAPPRRDRAWPHRRRLADRRRHRHGADACGPARSGRSS